MPLNTVSDRITDQEIAFAHLLLSGTMNDRCAAKTAGLNPDAAAYTKAKPRVCDYMSRHRTAEKEKSVQQQAEELHPLALGRDRILARLWELASLSPEATRNNIAGQIKAMAMIVAIEGLIPGRRRSSARDEPAAPPPNHPNFYRAAWLRDQQQPDEDTGSAEAKPAAPQAPEPEPPSQPAPQVKNHPPAPDPAQTSTNIANPVLPPQRTNWVPEATGSILDTVADQANSLRRPFFPRRGFLGGRR